jgi:hypothetical protein
MGGRHLNHPIVGPATTPDGTGFWLMGSDASVFWYGTPCSMAQWGHPLNQPIVEIAQANFIRTIEAHRIDGPTRESRFR